MISFGEFAALYLLVWSNPAGPTRSPAARSCPTPRPTPPASTRQPLKWTSKLTPKSTIALPPPVFPALVSEHLYPPPDPLAKPDTRTVDQKAKDAAKAEHKRQQSLRRSHTIHAEFLVGLPKVQRALANVPTYMMLDDHEITDDLFLVADLARPRARRARSAWRPVHQRHARLRPVPGLGQRPAALRQRPAGRAAHPRPRAVPRRRHHRAGEGAVRADLRCCSATTCATTPTASAASAVVNPPIHWHFTVDAPTHRVISLDNRTRRSYASRLGPPGNVSVDAHGRPGPQAAAARRPAGAGGDRPAAGDRAAGDRRPRRAAVVPRVRPGDRRRATSTRPTVADAAPPGCARCSAPTPTPSRRGRSTPPVFEQLLEGSSRTGAWCCCRGDVHNSSATAMSYWRGSATQPVALRAVHVERVQERDAGDDHRRRPRRRRSPSR